MIGHGYWSRTLKTMVGKRVEVWYARAQGGDVIEGELKALDFTGIRLLLDDGDEPHIGYERLARVEQV